jgi:hypothetical protein
MPGLGPLSIPQSLKPWCKILGPGSMTLVMIQSLRSGVLHPRSLRVSGTQGFMLLGVLPHIYL